VAYIKVICRNFSEETEENHENPQSAQKVAGPRFEPWTSRKRGRSVNRSNATFGYVAGSKHGNVPFGSIKGGIRTSRLNLTVLWDVAPCSLVEVYRRFRSS
jgi:hypothetical protein